MNRTLLLTIIVATLAAIAGAVAGALLLAPDKPAELSAGTLLDAPRPLPEFHMTRHDNSAFTRQDFEGRWSLVFFGFTHCPDVCPNTLFLLDRVVRTLELQDIAAPEVVFVSVDAARDTPEQLAGYVEYFNSGFTGIVGDDDNLRALARALSVAYEIRRHDGEDDYEVIHSSAILLVDPKARLHALFTPPLHADRIASDLAELVSD